MQVPSSAAQPPASAAAVALTAAVEQLHAHAPPPAVQGTGPASALTNGHMHAQSSAAHAGISTTDWPANGMGTHGQANGHAAAANAPHPSTSTRTIGNSAAMPAA